ncbi:hypothetical protein MmarC5_0939 [Methanococcus maripaludis C5]|uniref:Uncharacterized protein n=1 Tax=Methanococcus maripaludis (strain C5 / ATCC BAA-1333) TaxID=402880 RepID=A4FYG1_METM5|nr:hypothetical protein [Methanococcus maripaludis]ABO35245.1 hypothetical protein MmarC5_0939 [Methanococcus maripaludis C5]
MGVIDFDKLPKPARVNLSYGRVVAYPHKKSYGDEAQVINEFDPEHAGYVLIESYANCPSRDLSKQAYLTHMDMRMIILAYQEDDRFRAAIDDGYHINALDELKKLRSTGASLTTLQSAGKDYGLCDGEIADIFRRGYR